MAGDAQGPAAAEHVWTNLDLWAWHGTLARIAALPPSPDGARLKSAVCVGAATARPKKFYSHRHCSLERGWGVALVSALQIKE